ncbi:lipid IV(A) 3-deoxy-D-manno-octulosonic acid transferase [Marinobacter sp. X15-166B]|uniref:lipid IV(A) 3-deoxy-D-manno-octulosonic acid transferase n=1 Tax=Marinobacter sp. X15-166B TaxID=1897620 RepID=UPI00085BCB0E|nr:lipid IV(A) 3-deoxy-D-manno-octulosonic acid transferase [Marinobacter sp. X15-166B]OEY66599.1 3-deoxy-D-manno-octulosonic acid transferase [Marinobacter sp. X15-166B]
MLHFLYSTFFRLALPFIMVKLWWHSRRSPGEWLHWQQRLGFVPRSEQPVIWVHAVSVGETIAAAPLVTALLEREPGARILMTAMTATGARQAEAIFGDRVRYAFSPYDTPGSVRRFVDRINPSALVIMETELWPNMISLTRARNVPVFLINARLSERSAQGYERLQIFARTILSRITWIAAQANDDAQRFLRLGARPESVSVTGSVKYDVVVDDPLRAAAARLRQDLGARPVWIAASTHVGEDQQLLACHQQILKKHHNALLILVPRHPERFASVAALVREQGLTLTRRTEHSGPVNTQVYLGDTMGELLMLYGAADMAFVGGSLVERGGHNPLEPAAWGIPVLSGPHVFNFEAIYAQLAEGKGLFKVANDAELARCVSGLMDGPEVAGRVGANALATVTANRGALHKVVDGIVERV